MSEPTQPTVITVSADELLAPIAYARFPRFREWLELTGRRALPGMRADELADNLIAYVEDAVDRLHRR